MATTTTVIPSTPSTTPAHISFYDRVSPPGDILETMVIHASTFMQYGCRCTLNEDDVRKALDFLNISVDETKSAQVEANDENEEFRKRVKQILSDKHRSDPAIAETAFSLLKLVETEYQKKENFKASPHKEGGRLLVLESPTGVTAKCFEFEVCDDASIVMEDDDEDDEWNTTQEANEENNNNESDDESIIRRGMLIDEEDWAESDEE